MNRGTLLTVLGTALSVAALAFWAYAAPAAGSGWILFFAFIGALNLLDSIKNGTLATVSGAAITATAAFIWFTNQGVEHAGWVGFLAILTGLGTMTALNNAVRRNT
jgi:hypothetical protein